MANDIRAALDDLDRCDLATLLHHLLPRLDAMETTMATLQERTASMPAIEAAMKTLLERSAPRSNCSFCTVDENRDRQSPHWEVH